MKGQVRRKRYKKSKSSRKKFTTMMDPELRKALKIIATHEEVSAADIIEGLLLDYVSEYNEKRPFHKLGLFLDLDSHSNRVPKSK